MVKGKVMGAFLVGLVVACVVFVVVLFLIKVLWAWTMPDLFPGAVTQGLVAESISWMTAAKIAVLIAVLSAFIRGHGSER